MLKRERTPLYRREIAIRFRSRDPFLSRYLVVGLSVAAALHLALFFLIDSAPYQTPIEQINAPRQVIVDLGFSAVASQTIDEGLFARYTAPLASESPTLPSLGPEAIEHRSLLAINLASGDFSQTRRPVAAIHASSFLIHKRYKPARIEVSGPLATYTLLDDGTAKWGKRRVNRARTRLFSLLFDVQLEEKTGNIFWFSQVTSTENSALDAKGREILQGLRFAPNPYGVTAKGRVEICFEVEGGDPLGLLLEQPPEETASMH